MSYAHMFYGVDVAALKKLAGSGDEAFVEAFLADPPEDFAELDLSDLAPAEALRRIVAGTAHQDGPEHAATYGYVLKSVCGYLTRKDGDGYAGLLDGEAACLEDLPFALRLPGSGPPVPIPYDEADFPEIGYLERHEIDAELAALAAPPGRPKKPPLKLRIFAWLFQKRTGVVLNSLRTPDAEEVAEEVEEYRNALNDAKARGTGVVSFRH